MPETYEYQGDVFDSEMLSGMMHGDFLETSVEEVDRLVSQRDKGSSAVLDNYRKRTFG